MNFINLLHLTTVLWTIDILFPTVSSHAIALAEAEPEADPFKISSIFGKVKPNRAKISSKRRPGLVRQLAVNPTPKVKPWSFSNKHKPKPIKVDPSSNKNKSGGSNKKKVKRKNKDSKKMKVGLTVLNSIAKITETVGNAIPQELVEGVVSVGIEKIMEQTHTTPSPVHYEETDETDDPNDNDDSVTLSKEQFEKLQNFMNYAQDLETKNAHLKSHITNIMATAKNEILELNAKLAEAKAKAIAEEASDDDNEDEQGDEVPETTTGNSTITGIDTTTEVVKTIDENKQNTTQTVTTENKTV